MYKLGDIDLYKERPVSKGLCFAIYPSQYEMPLLKLLRRVLTVLFILLNAGNWQSRHAIRSAFSIFLGLILSAGPVLTGHSQANADSDIVPSLGSNQDSPPDKVDVKSGMFDKTTLGKDISVISSPSRISVRPAVPAKANNRDSFAIGEPSAPNQSGVENPADNNPDTQAENPVENSEKDRISQMRQGIQAAAGDSGMQSVLGTAQELSRRINGIPSGQSGGQSGSIPDPSYYQKVINAVEQHTDQSPSRRRQRQKESNRF